MYETKKNCGHYRHQNLVSDVTPLFDVNSHLKIQQRVNE